MRRWAVLGAVLLLAACSKGGPQDAKTVEDVVRTAGQPEAAAAPPDQTQNAPAAANAAQPASAAAPMPPATPMLAYSYDYGVEAPPAKVRPLMSAQQQACVAAGPAVCQVTGAETSSGGPDQITAKLSFRATPAWLQGFEASLSQRAGDAGGRLIRSQVTSEDLTRDIVDTDAAVRAKTALRDRLQTLLETHPGKVDDLLSVEEALSKAQADLDQTTSELAVMRQRVATSDVAIEYDSAGVLAPQGAWSPVAKAAASVVGAIAGSVAVIIYLVAAILPWGLLIAGVLWLFRARLPRIGRRRAATAPVPPPTTPPKA